MSIDAQASSQSPRKSEEQIARHTIYLALGTNLGDRRGNLTTALQRLREIMEMEIVSSVYETEPVGYTDQPRFLNLVCRGETRLEAQALLLVAKEIEAAVGRTPSVRNGPRLIDIDILFYDDLHIQKSSLTIPHPRIYERAFVLVPLAEIAPEFKDPISGKTVQELTEAISHVGVTLLENRDTQAFDQQE
jgi:GTP cyclohydrolase IV